MPRNWGGNVQIQLGGFFWVFLTVAVLSFVAWKFGWFREGKLGSMLSYSMTGDRSKVFSEN